jgi:cytochrome c5
MKKTLVMALTVTLIGFVGAAHADRNGEEVYNKTCKVCHEQGVAGAPKLGDKVAWAPRIATGMDTLLKTVHTGKGAMPPKGTCMDCTEAEFKATVEFMTSKAQ